MTASSVPAAHWDSAYAQSDTTLSWFQAQPHMSLQMFDAAGITPDDGVVDVGAGASQLAGILLERQFTDVTVLDISAAGLAHARQRLGPEAGRISWVVADILTWRPPRRYQVWHDRAVFHFLTTGTTREKYLQTLQAATTVHATAIFGCFAPDGPQHCSGLAVTRYGPGDLAATLGHQWSLIGQARENHTTPGGVVQPFTWTAFRRETCR